MDNQPFPSPAAPRNVVLVGDATARLAELPASSVDCVVTSPPYFQLRDYGVTGQAGNEDTVQDWVDGLRQVLAECARVLVPRGTLWLNLGDSFATHPRQGGSRKSLLLGPERMAIAAAADGWIVRNKVVWAKTNPLPTSVRDRLALTYEVVYLLVRQRDYFFDLDAIGEPHRSKPTRRTVNRAPSEPWRGRLAMSRRGLAEVKADGRVGHPLGKNPGDVWRTATSRYHGAHFATFPPGLVRRPIASGCPERVCTNCAAPWRRSNGVKIRPSCTCKVSWRPGLVLDPFMGAGTVGLVAEQLGRDWLGIELNPFFAASESRFRQRFSWAHEIKHIIDHPAIAFLYPGADGKPSDQRAEQAANYFAACLLMPRVFIQQWWDEGIHHPVDLAWRCAVNPSAMKIRLRQLGLTAVESGHRSDTA